MPEISIEDNHILDVVEEVKLLGIKIRSDLKWTANTDYICEKSFKRLWILRRLKALGADKTELIDVYKKQVLSVLELGVPVWAPGLTKHEVTQIESAESSYSYNYGYRV